MAKCIGKPIILSINKTNSDITPCSLHDSAMIQIFKYEYLCQETMNAKILAQKVYYSPHICKAGISDYYY